MARKRMIDPCIWDSEQVMSLTPAQFKLYIFLISQADDMGRIKYSPLMLKSRVHPLVEYEVEQIAHDVESIVRSGLVKSYGNGEYLYHPNWKTYQKIDHPSESKLPDPVSFTEDSPNAHRGLTEDSPNAHRGLAPNLIEVNRREVKVREKKVAASAAIVKTDPLYHRVEAAFLSKNDGKFDDYAKEGVCIHAIVKKARSRSPEEPEALLSAMLAAFWKLKTCDTSSKGFWRGQPFLPSALSPLWSRVLETMRNDTVDPEVMKMIQGGAA